MAESLLYPPGDSIFVTLTYADENVPHTQSGVPTTRIDDLTRFVRNLRKNTGKRIRFYAVTEYGKKHNRPHGHVILYGLNLLTHRMKTPWKPSAADQANLDRWNLLWRQYSDTELEVLRAWRCKGSIAVSDFQKGRAGYVQKSRYMSKALRAGGPGYEADQEIEKFRMSRNPGIGVDWAKGMAPAFASSKAEFLEQGFELLTDKTRSFNSVRFMGRKWPIDRTMRKYMLPDVRDAETRFHHNRHLRLYDSEPLGDYRAAKAGSRQVEKWKKLKGTL